MSASLEDLARRAIACKGWRFMPGMLTQSGLRVVTVEDDGAYVLALPGGWHQRILLEGQHLPDLTDPATVGCLLALVRKVWGDPSFFVRRAETMNKDTDMYGWDAYGWLDGRSCRLVLYRSEAEALVAALEAGP